MSNPWKGYVAANDDVRHTYERVFYGRQLTGDNAESVAPGLSSEVAVSTDPAKEASPAAALYGQEADPTQAERFSTAAAYEHAANAPGIRAEIDAASGQPYRYADAPPIPNNTETNAHAQADFYGAGKGQGRGVEGSDLYGPAASPGPSEGSGLYGGATEKTPAIEAPPIEPAAAAQPSQGNDMTPG